MKENTLELSFEMYEELKETLIKTLRTELAEARSQPTASIDTDAIKQLQIRILQLEQTQTRVSEAQQERAFGSNNGCKRSPSGRSRLAKTSERRSRRSTRKWPGWRFSRSCRRGWCSTASQSHWTQPVTFGSSCRCLS